MTSELCLYQGLVDGAEALNPRIIERYRACDNDADIERTHFFAGRFENVYVPLERVPELQTVIDEIYRRGRDVLGQPDAEFKSAFWFNEMQPGHRTLPHHHDELDEMLSAVYYVDVPPDSGSLILRDDENETSIRPKAGMLVLFYPWVMHEVSENRSHATRLSVAFNLGPVNSLL